MLARLNDKERLLKENDSQEIYVFRQAIYDYNKYIICCEYDNEEQLYQNWEDFVQNVAINIQTNLDRMIEKMNIYIFFFVSGGIEKEIRQLIENDKYSSRKIIIEEGMSSNLDEILDKVNKRLLVVNNIDVVDTNESSIEEALKEEDELLYDLYKSNGGKVTVDLFLSYAEQVGGVSG